MKPLSIALRYYASFYPNWAIGLIALPADRAEPGPRLGAHLDAHQVGAIRWTAVDKLVTLIYVRPQMRRHGVATALWHQSSGTPGRPGRPRAAPVTSRTALSEVWLRSTGRP